MTTGLAPGQDIELLERLAASIQMRWASGETPDAVAAFNAHPELLAHKPIVLELAYEEFCLRAERGTAPEPRRFAAQFPYWESIARLLAVHSAIGRHPSFGSVGRPAVRLTPGDAVGDWEVVRRLGRGGFADVYLVTNPRLGGQPAVLKVSNGGEQEAHTLGRLNHKHVMEVSDSPPVGGRRAVLSPYLGLATGETLVERAYGNPSSEWLLRVAREQPPGDPPVAARAEFPITDTMPYPQAVLHIAAAVAGTLAYVHEKGLSHRDLKPSNLLIGPTGHPYLLDFNLAGDGRSGRVGGTIGYAAPEVVAVLTMENSSDTERSSLEVNWPAADVFSFAVLVFELLRLEHPYLVGEVLDSIDGGTVARAAASAREKLSATRLPLASAVRQLLLDCLHPNPAARPTAVQLAHGLNAMLAPRRVWPWVTAAAVVVALSGVGVAWAWAWAGDHKQPVSEETEREPTEPFARGVWLVEGGESAAAIRSFQKAAETDTSGRAFEWLAYCVAREKAYSVASDYGTRALAAGRKTVAVYANRSATRSHTADDLGAMADAEEALKIDANCKVARINRGIAMFRLLAQGQPVPREIVDDLKAGMQEDERRGGMLMLAAEVHVRVQNPNDADREWALWAVNRAVRAGYSPANVEKRTVFKDQLGEERLRAALIVTDDERLALDLRPQLVLPNPD